MKHSIITVPPIAYEVLGNSVPHTQTEDDGLLLDIPLFVMEKIKTRTEGQLPWYLRQKAFKYIQCAMLSEVIHILSGEEVSFKMAYFQTHLMEWRDAMVRIGNKERFAVAITSSHHIAEHLLKSQKIEHTNVQSKKNGYWNAHTNDNNVWRVIVWLPPYYNKRASAILDTVHTIQDVHSSVWEFIARSWLSSANTIEVAATNKRWKKTEWQISSILRI